MNFFQETDDSLEKLLLIENIEVENIEDEDRRKLVREWMEKAFIPLKEEYMSNLSQIEERLHDTSVINQKYEVVTGIVDKKHYDNTEVFKPINIEDLDAVSIDTQQLIASMQEGKEYRLYSVYFDDSYEELNRLIHRQYMFDITAYTEYGCYKGKAAVKESRRYDDRLRKLYETFVNNNISWSPINTCFVKRMLELQIVSLDIPMSDEAIERIEIDFGEYKDRIKCDMIPVWNIDTERISTSVYPVPTVYGNYFKHIISKGKLEKDCSYLVTGESHIYGVEYVSNIGIEINCDARRPVKWESWKIVHIQNNPTSSIEYRKNKVIAGTEAVNTLGETIRYVNSLEIEGLELINVTLDSISGNIKVQNYDMDYFINDKIGAFNNSPVMYFEWKVKDIHDKWNIDRISYAVTCLSKVYVGYRIENIIR